MRKKLRKKRVLSAAILVTVTFLAVTIIIVVLAVPVRDVFGNRAKPEHAAEVFLGMIQSQNTVNAYYSSSTAFQEKASAEDFAIFVERFPILRNYTTLNFTSVELDGSLATVRGTISDSENESPIMITLTRELDVWRVLNISLNPEDASKE